MNTLDFTIVIYIVAGIISWVVMALCCAWLAGQKGRDKITWGMIGLLLGLLALKILAVAPPKKTEEVKQ